MGSSRLKGLVLVALVAVLAMVVYRTWPSRVGLSTSASGTVGGGGTTTPETPLATPDVRLEALESERAAIGTVKRNLFEFERRAPREEPAVSRPVVNAAPSRPPPPTVAPIPLKFIGIVEAPARSLVIAVLSDERGVYHGREGEIVEGRYRIWRIGAESIEVSHLDGSGRQTIRLSGL